YRHGRSASRRKIAKTLNPGYRFWGIAFALAGTVAFAFRPVLIKLGYQTHPVSATTLLFLRMTLSLPFFLVMAWWMRRSDPAAAPIARRGARRRPRGPPDRAPRLARHRRLGVSRLFPREPARFPRPAVHFRGRRAPHH